jgi:hypothetical protein
VVKLIGGNECGPDQAVANALPAAVGSKTSRTPAFVNPPAVASTNRGPRNSYRDSIGIARRLNPAGFYHPTPGCCAVSTPASKVFSIECYVHDSTDSSGESEIALPFNVLSLRLGACGEFSNYSIEGIGRSSGRPRLARRTKARGSNSDFQRTRLDQPDETPCCARPTPRYLQSIICSTRRCGLANH